MVPRTRLELVRSCERGILNPLCLPFHHPGPRKVKVHDELLPKVCQLKCLSLLAAFFLLSCATQKRREFEPEALLSLHRPKWFSANEKHSLRDSTGKNQTHLFFDISPEFTEKDQFANVVITTLENSHLAYSVDVVSGQRYYSHSYCNQGDVWNKKSGTFGRPYFSIGFMPRILDQAGDPQKVIVFGGRDRLKASLDHDFVRVRIIGSYIEESCPDANCLSRDTWVSRLVFVAVDPMEPNYSDVKDISDFLVNHSWEKLQPTLENLDGRNFSGDRTYPATRVKKLLLYKESLQLFRKRSAFMSDTEIEKIQKGCHALYDKLWADVGLDRDEDKPSLNQDELRKKLKVREELGDKKKPIGKIARFQRFIKKYFNETATCEKFVYHGNINNDPERFWFYSYIGMYTRLHKEGYYFDCRRKAWTENIYNVNGDPVHLILNEIDLCTDKDIDLAMGYMPNLLKSVKSVLGRHYRFIDYDTHEFGTHRKIYSWVQMKNKKFDCRPDPNRMIMDKMSVFPEDVSWKRWDVIDVANEMKIIY